jgi:N-carbamoyl-L-amino-acid hydrolase
VVEEINRIGLAQRPHGRATVGRLLVQPNSPNVVPGRVVLTVDMRHPDETVLKVMDAELRAGVGRIAADNHLDCDLQQTWYAGPVRFEPACIAAVRHCTEDLAYPHRDMVSGAGHDACYLSRVAPTGMIFIPCVGGLSHNETEHATPEWVEAGANVLLRVAVAKANEAGH